MSQQGLIISVDSNCSGGREKRPGCGKKLRSRVKPKFSGGYLSTVQRLLNAGEIVVPTFQTSGLAGLQGNGNSRLLGATGRLGQPISTVNSLKTVRNLRASSTLRVVSRCGVGMENVDQAAARRLGIQVFSTPNAPTVAVAELTIGALICLLRRVAQMDQTMHAGGWEKFSGPQVRDKTVAVVGLGRIGLQVAAYLRAFGARVIGVDPMRHGEVDGIPVVSLTEALAQAHIVSLHASGSAEILGAAEFAKLRRGAYVLNTGRGGLVNETALQAALDEGKIAGAWLDAFVEEPYRGPLKNYRQVLLTPHVGYSSDEARRQMEVEATDNLLKALVDPS